MKILLLTIILACLSCSSEPKTPVVCHQNLMWCSSQWNISRPIPLSEWNRLCLEDFQTCKSGWGMQ